MIYRVKVRVRARDDRAETDRRRDQVRSLVDQHGGKDVTGPKPRAHVVGAFADKTAARAFRTEARAALTPAQP